MLYKNKASLNHFYSFLFTCKSIYIIHLNIKMNVRNSVTFIFLERILTITKILNVLSFSQHKHILTLSVSWPQINCQFCKSTTEKNLISTEKRHFSFLLPVTSLSIFYFNQRYKEIFEHLKEK